MTSISDNILHDGKELISKLLLDPSGFSQYNELLNLFFKGLPLEMLGNILQHSNNRVISGSLFIAEELGQVATSLLGAIIAHVQDRNPRIRISAYNALGSCISNGHEGEFLYIVRGIQDADLHCRKIAMLWMIRASETWLRGALEKSERSDADGDIQRSLRMLLGKSSAIPAQIESWMQDQSSLVRKIGVIAAGRIADKFPHLLETAVKNEDSDLRECAAAQTHFLAIQNRKIERLGTGREI